MKIGFYCRVCDAYSDAHGKLYTVSDPKLYTVLTNDYKHTYDPTPGLRAKISLDGDLDPGPLPYQGNALPG